MAGLNMRRLIALVVLAGCEGRMDPSAAPDASSPGGGSEPAAVTFTDDEKTALHGLRYDASPPPADPSNKYADSPAARVLGQKLFFDPGLSGPLIESDNDGLPGSLGVQGEAGKVSCAGCHVPHSGFVDTRSRGKQVSLAAQWSFRRSPSLLDVSFAPLLNWDGRRDSIWRQAVGVMESEREFNAGRLLVALQMFRTHRTEYEAVFNEQMPPLDDATRFPQLQPAQAGCVERSTPTGAVYDCRGRPGDGADYDHLMPNDQVLVTHVTVNAGKAIEAYVRQLRCGSGRFDAWLDGDASALSQTEQRGAKLFIGKAACLTCHSGPRLTDEKFHNVGVAPKPVAVAIVDSNDHGASDGIAAALADPLNTRGAFSDGDRGTLPPSVDASLDGAFRTPGLRCLSSHPSFMHTAALSSVKQVVDFFNRGGDPADSYPGVNELTHLSLTDDEKADLTAFLATLEGPGADPSLLMAP
jgi:cytochrome c peroxidase